MAKSEESDSKEVVAKEEAKLPTTGEVSAEMLMEDMGQGTSDLSSDDLAIPYISILQKGSPQVNKRAGEYVEGAEAGYFYNNVTGEIFDGEQGIIIVPVAYNRRYVEWVTRENGGGFVQDHGNNPEILDQTTKNEKGQDILPNGHQIVNTATHYVYLVHEETGSFEQALIAMTSTQLKKSRRWNSLQSKLQVPRPDGKGFFNPACFYMSYKFTTVYEENDQGDWMGYKIEQHKPTTELPNGGSIYLAAREFRKQVASGNVRTAPPPSEQQMSDNPAF